MLKKSENNQFYHILELIHYMKQESKHHVIKEIINLRRK